MLRHAMLVLILAAAVPAAPAAADGDTRPVAAATGVASGSTPVPLLLELRPVALPAPEGLRPTRGATLPALYVGLAGLNAFDAYTTTVGLSKGATEANPLLKSVADRPAALWGLKAGVTAGSIVLAEKLWRNNRRGAAIAMMVASNGVMAAVAARNLQVLNRAR
jgi:hypothetical protein